MKVLVTGATGLVGSELGHFLPVRRDVRLTHSTAAQCVWDRCVRFPGIDGSEVVVHLAGENISGKRWTPKFKDQLWHSRIDSTKLLCETIANLETPPRTLICASAIGFYGDRGTDWLNETSAPGSGFLPDLCRDWEAACQPAREKGIRVINLRTGVVLSPKGGALAKMLTPFKMGVGGILGTGNQFVSWVTIDDVVGSSTAASNRRNWSDPSA